MSAYDAPSDAARASAASAASARAASVGADWNASAQSGIQMPATTTPDVARNSRRVQRLGACGLRLGGCELGLKVSFIFPSHCALVRCLLHEVSELGNDELF